VGESGVKRVRTSDTNGKRTHESLLGRPISPRPSLTGHLPVERVLLRERLEILAHVDRVDDRFDAGAVLNRDGRHGEAVGDEEILKQVGVAREVVLRPEIQLVDALLEGLPR
jgi:hypothetical protein